MALRTPAEPHIAEAKRKRRQPLASILAPSPPRHCKANATTTLTMRASQRVVSGNQEAT